MKSSSEVDQICFYYLTFKIQNLRYLKEGDKILTKFTNKCFSDIGINTDKLFLTIFIDLNGNSCQ